MFPATALDEFILKISGCSSLADKFLIFQHQFAHNKPSQQGSIVYRIVEQGTHATFARNIHFFGTEQQGFPSYECVKGTYGFFIPLLHPAITPAKKTFSDQNRTLYVLANEKASPSQKSNEYLFLAVAIK